jgi:type I restriction enzyme S subunit
MIDWRQVSLGDLFTEPKDRKIPEASDRHYVGMQHIDPETTRIARWAEPTAATSMSKVFRKNDVLFGRLRPYLKKVALAGFDGVCSGEILVLRANESVLPGFLYLLAANGTTIKHAVDVSAGSRMPRVASKDLSALEVALPPRPVQERIVEVIGAVDDQITALDAEANALTDVYLAATSLLWLTSPGDEAGSRSLGDVMYLDIVRMPMEAGTTYHLAGVLNAGKGLVDKESFDGADTEYTAMNILRENQVVMRKLTAWEGPITVVPAEFDGFVASNEFPTFTLTDDVSPRWMKHVCRTPRLWAEMQSRVVGTVQRRKRLNPDQLLSVTLPLPSRPEQEQAAEALDAMEEQAFVIRAEADRLRSVRARLLAGLLDHTIDIESAKLEV